MMLLIHGCFVDRCAGNFEAKSSIRMGRYESNENILAIILAPALAVAEAPEPPTAVPVCDEVVSLLSQFDGCWSSMMSTLGLMPNLLATTGPTMRMMNSTNMEK